MSTQYPAGFDTFASPNAGDPASNPSVSGTYKNLAASVLAIETELGQNPSGAYTDVTTRFANIGGGGGSTSSFPPDATFAAGVSAGATSFSITVAPGASGLNGARSALLLIDDGVGAVEIIRATFSGTTGTVSTPSGNGAAQIGRSGFLKAHSSGATIRWLRDNKIDPVMVMGTLPDEGLGVQAALIYAYRWAAQIDFHYSSYGTRVSVFCGTLDIGDGGFSLVGASPWSHTPYLDPNRSLTNPSFDHSTYVMRTAREIDSFTATASNDRFTATNLPQGGHGLTLGAAISFSNPMGETMPGGVTAGMTYYVKDFPTASTFRLSTVSSLADTVDVTSDGAGWLYTNWDSLLRIYCWGRLFVGSQAQDVCGLAVCVQQDNSITSLRTRMYTSASTTDRAISLWITGQIGNFGDIETDLDGSGQVGAVIAAPLFRFKGGWWIQHNGLASTSMIVSGFGHKFNGGEIESVATTGVGIRLVNQVTNCDFGDWVCSGFVDPNVPFIEDHTDQAGSYHVGQVVGTNHPVYDAPNNKYPLEPLGMTPLGFKKLFGGKGWVLDATFHQRVVAGTTTMVVDCDTYLCDTTSGVATLNLPIGTQAARYTIRRIAGANNVVLHPQSGQNVEGSSSDYTSTFATPAELLWDPSTTSWWIV